MSAPSTRRPPTFGPEPWAEVAGQPWCHWDRWYCVVAVLDHDGDLGGVEDTLVAALSDALWGRAAAEAKLSHLAELRRRLDNAHLQSTDLVGPDDLADEVLVTKARRKVSDRGLEGRAMTPAMVDTPRERLVRRARRGWWADFPVDPQRYYASFHRHVELKGHVSKNRSFDVVERLEERLERLDSQTVALSERLGLYRAFHSAGLELADRADDSFGVVGELRQRAWHTYLGLEWREAGIVPETYWADLCELVVWEDYGRLPGRAPAVPGRGPRRGRPGRTAAGRPGGGAGGVPPRLPGRGRRHSDRLAPQRRPTLRPLRGGRGADRIAELATGGGHG